MSTDKKRPGYWWRLASLSLLIVIVAVGASRAVTQAYGYSDAASLTKGVILAAACLMASVLVRRLR